MISTFLFSIWATVAPGMGNHLWQSTLCLAIAGLLTLTLRKNHARARYGVWLAASIKFLVPFSLLIGIGSHVARPREVPQADTGFLVVVEQVGQPFSAPAARVISPVAHATSLTNLLVLLPAFVLAVWLCGFVVVLFTWYSQWRRISAAQRKAMPLREGREVDALRRVERIGGVLSPIRLLLSPGSLEPGIFGIARPVLVWPRGISERLNDPQMETIMAHEVWHVRRRDNLTAAIHMVVEAIFWFHPLVWWLGSRMVDERERACDEKVLECGGDRKIYAESVLKTCEFCIESPLACVSGVTGADLKKRIVRIMTQEGITKLDFSRKLLLASFGLTAVLGPIVLGLKVGTRLWAQKNQSGDARRPSFAAASIKPNPGCENKPPKGGTFTPSPDRMEMPCVSLTSLIQTAYGTFADGVTVDPQPLHMEGGPPWMQSEFYSVSAKAEAPPPHPQMMDGPMLQVLLEERFRLKTHRETREMPVYSMTVGKGGLKVQPLAEGACMPIDFVHPPVPPKPGELPNICGVMLIRPSGTGEVKIDARGATMTQFAQRLSQLSGRTVIEQTGIAGRFNFHIEFTPDPAIPGQKFSGVRRGDIGNATNSSSPLPLPEPGPDLFVALQEQVGLELSSEKGPVNVLIIDDVQRPSEN